MKPHLTYLTTIAGLVAVIAYLSTVLYSAVPESHRADIARIRQAQAAEIERMEAQHRADLDRLQAENEAAAAVDRAEFAAVSAQLAEDSKRSMKILKTDNRQLKNRLAELAGGEAVAVSDVTATTSKAGALEIIRNFEAARNETKLCLLDCEHRLGAQKRAMVVDCTRDLQALSIKNVKLHQESQVIAADRDFYQAALRKERGEWWRQDWAIGVWCGLSALGAFGITYGSIELASKAIR